MQKQVLIIDDEPILRDLFSDFVFLSAHGLSTVTAENGAKGVEIFQKTHHDIALVILDVLMPVMDGITAFPLLREISINTPILFLSGYSADDKLAHYSTLPRVGFMQKPF